MKVENSFVLDLKTSTIKHQKSVTIPSKLWDFKDHIKKKLLNEINEWCETNDICFDKSMATLYFDETQDSELSIFLMSYGNGNSDV